MAEETQGNTNNAGYSGPKIRFSRDLARRSLTDKIQEARDLLQDITEARITTYGHLNEAKRKASMWDRLTESDLTTQYTDLSILNQYIGSYGFDDSLLEPKERTLQDEVQELRSFVDTRMKRLNAILNQLPTMPVLDEEEQEREMERIQGRHRVDPNNRERFVVHGRDVAARDAVARCLERLDLSR